MAKVAVGGTNGLIDRLLTLVGWKVTSTTSDQERIDALAACNFAEQFIAQAEALSYLRVRSTLSANATGVAVPADLDFGKDYTIETSDVTDVVAYKSPDEFARFASADYDRVASKAAVHLLAVDGSDSILKFFFKPTPVTEVLPITYQQIPPALTDSNASFSLLPAGYEVTILLTVAEQYIKRRRHAIDADFLDAAAKDMLGAFYDKFRDNKQKAVTDQNRQRRKIEEEQLAPGA